MAAAKKKTAKRKTTSKKASVKKQDELVHVGIANPADVYKIILETSKGTIEHLREFERLKSVRDEKNALLKEFAKLITSIKSDIAFVEKQLPKENVHFKVHKDPVIVKTQEPVVQEVEEKPVVKEAPVIREPSSELEKLEMELQAIENKLSGL